MTDNHVPPNMNGPETAPLLKYVKKYLVDITIYDGDDVVKKVTIDYGDFEQRKWLGRLSYWAWIEGYTVETMTAE